MTIIDKTKCIACGMCIKECFTKAIIMQDGKAHFKEKASCMECGHCLAVCPVNAVELDNYPQEEILDAEHCVHAIDPKVYLNHLKLRRSIRAFKDIPVTDEEIGLILEAGRFSPTGGNEQTVSYHIIRDGIAEYRTKLLDQLKVQADEAFANGKPSSWYPYVWLRLYKTFRDKGEDQLFFDAPLVIAIASESPQDGMIAAAHMETMIYSLGLGMLYSGFSTRAINGSEEIKKSLEIKDNYTCWTTLIIGRPDVEFKRSVPRKPADAVWR